MAKERTKRSLVETNIAFKCPMETCKRYIFEKKILKYTCKCGAVLCTSCKDIWHEIETC
jgi:hypothetical protein